MLRSEACVIIHNMLIRKVDKEFNEDDGDENIFIETYYDYMNVVTAEGAEDGDGGGDYAERGPQLNENEIDFYMETFIENTMIQELIMTSKTGSASLKKVLVQRFRNDGWWTRDT